MRRINWVISVCALLLVAAQPADAGMILFDFNLLQDNASNAQVQSYIQSIINLAHPGGIVTITGAKAERGYTGDGHVVGPASGGTVRAETLGTSDGGVHHLGLDTFLQNQNSDRITITFSFPVFMEHAPSRARAAIP